MELGILFGLGSALAFGSGDFAGGFATRRVNGVTVAAGPTPLACCLVLGPPGRPAPAAAERRVSWRSARSPASFGGIGLVALYRGLSLGSMGIVAALSGCRVGRHPGARQRRAGAMPR